MAHQSLYRAYRPQNWKEVSGQPQVTEALSQQIKDKKVAHAYLFAGSRGLGKTSVARIFARELGTSERDLYEIDAASNNSVDDIRALSENVYTLPFESPYKVYILDEAHMLSKGAWNAFLKTLEEPPAHAIFILATTELSRVPETVQSRCQVFTFKKPSRAELAKVVANVAKKEGHVIKTDAADLIALLAEGSYRDALSILERVLRDDEEVTGGIKHQKRDDEGRKILTLAWVELWTGAPKHELVAKLASALSAGDQGAALSAIRATADAGVDMQLYLSLVLDYLRAVLLVRAAPELRKDFEEELGADQYGEVEKLAGAKDSKLTHGTLKAFLDAATRIRYASVPSLPLELAVLELFSQD